MLLSYHHIAILEVSSIVIVGIAANITQVVGSNPDSEQLNNRVNNASVYQKRRKGKYLPVVGKVDLGVGLQLLS